MRMRVKNINVNETGNETCKCGSWFEHWKKFSRSLAPRFCPEKTCAKPPEFGAHVQKDDSADGFWYIVPLCRDCNAKTGSAIDIVDTVELVSADTNETCDR